jgi:hypothetical protein
MRQGLRALVAGGLGLAVSLIAACGSSNGLLSASTANNLVGQLQQVSTDIQRGDCAAAADQLATVTQQIENLPSSVSSTLRTNLDQGLTKAQELLASQCRTTATTTPNTTATTTTPTTTTETATQPTTTQTTPTITTTTTSPTTTTPATTKPETGTTSTAQGSGGVAPGTNTGGSPGQAQGNGNGNGH